MTRKLLKAELRPVWDAAYRSHYWVLSGTYSILDGTVMALATDSRPMADQARVNLAAINRRRLELCLLPIEISGL